MNEVIEKLQEINEDAILYDGFEEALIGIAERPGMNPVALYDQNKMINIQMVMEETSEEEAREHLEANVFCAYLGENTPVFAYYTLIEVDTDI